MIYLYDEAIVNDLKNSINNNEEVATIVNASGSDSSDPNASIMIAAQMENDVIQFPLVTVYRKSNMDIDSDRWNFSRLHKGVQAVIDHKTNNIYNERSIPIKLSYEISVMASNTADIDELIRELIFKYSYMYYLTIDLPYEADRKVRFGLVLDVDSGIERGSGTMEYLTEGQVYRSTITLNTEGCVLVDYVPQHLRRITSDIVAETP